MSTASGVDNGEHLEYLGALQKRMICIYIYVYMYIDRDADLDMDIDIEIWEPSKGSFEGSFEGSFKGVRASFKGVRASFELIQGSLLLGAQGSLNLLRDCTC